MVWAAFHLVREFTTFSDTFSSGSLGDQWPIKKLFGFNNRTSCLSSLDAVNRRLLTILSTFVRKLLRVSSLTFPSFIIAFKLLFVIFTNSFLAPPIQGWRVGWIHDFRVGWKQWMLFLFKVCFVLSWFSYFPSVPQFSLRINKTCAIIASYLFWMTSSTCKPPDSKIKAICGQVTC